MEKLTICRSCGRASEFGAAFCSCCGAPLDFSREAPSDYEGFQGTLSRLAFELWRLENELNAFLEKSQPAGESAVDKNSASCSP